MLRSSMFALVLLLTLAGAGTAGTGAQPPPPAAGEAGDEDAPARELLLQAAVRRLPESPAVVRLSRLTLELDAAQETAAPPGVEFAVVETGAPVAAVDGDAVLLPAADAGASQPLAAGAEVALAPGDRLAFPLGTPRAFRNDGTEPASLVIAAVLPADEAAEVGDAEGVTTEILGEGTAAELPAGTAVVTLERFRLTDGDGVPAYPGPALLAVEEGGFSSSLAAGDVQLSRGGGPGERPAGGPDDAFPVRPGDALFFPQGMDATPPLEGDGAVVLLRLGIRSVDLATAADAEEPFPVGATVVVARPDVRLRAEPSTDGAVLAGLAQGQTLLITGPPEAGSDRRWYPVADPTDPSLAGFVAAEFLAAG